MKQVVLTAILRKEGDHYIARCPEINTTSQGNGVIDAVNNLKAATDSQLAEKAQEFDWLDNDEVFVTTFELEFED